MEFKSLFTTSFFADIQKSRDETDLPHVTFLLCGILTALITIFFIGFIFQNAYPTFENQGLINFLTGNKWSYTDGVYGVRIFLLGTIIITFLTMIMAVPLGIFTAIYLAEYASEKTANMIRPFVELLVGIPSVVYGIFGFLILSNLFREYIEPAISNNLGFISIFYDTSPTSGTSILLASTILTIMILPTIVSISEYAMRSVPKEYSQGSFAMGTTHWETIRNIVLPTASGGIYSSIILGMMRAMGETMAVVMVVGILTKVPNSIFSGGYPMTSKILNDIGYHVAIPEHKSALCAVAAVLFALEILFVAIARKMGGNK
ncbi:phosphate ABC transporter permease subunit PstC [Methanohalophilus halophilus]|uniref:Phosphate transport system permease protein n=1 Tax=Methanohalophilus halophilus TaxID=2177 RepID=A0A1L3Q4H9_9EURY|nr:phosphate ABC transporter permease subunit PstC [Methanohalophilus halophilus]APH39748.1 phosphate ABC transporter permease subunit PstC [Methanohalophilus halophilus]RNI08913.1 phosphate ABC transporter permease subunit PstC [Methanohalophilus halophilus]SDW38645.1 phosphate ABC transporter membrane protein 1, PhoT family [Methanohalophilus halophilus]